MKHILLSLLVSTSAFSQTIWAPAKAYWKYQSSGMVGTSTIEIENIDSTLAGTTTQVLRQRYTTSYYGGNRPDEVSTYYILTYTNGDQVYLGTTVGNMALYYDFGKSKGQKAGKYDVDSTFTVHVSCASIRAYTASKIGDCTPKRLYYGTCYERLGNLGGMFFPWLNDCTASESFGALTEYRDASGFHYLNGNFSCDAPTGINDPTAQLPVTVSPNPSNETTVIEVPLASKLGYTIVDTRGQTVMQGIFSERVVLELPEAGIFLLRITQDGKVIGSRKLVKN